MPLTKQQLLDHARKHAAELQVEPITEAVLESWIASGLLKGATAKGRGRGLSPVWTYDDSAIGVVREIVELKSRGPIRTSQLRVCLWCSGHCLDFETVRNDLLAEFERLIKREHGRRPWKYNHNREVLLEKATEKYFAQLPALDSDLQAAGFGLPKLLMIEIVSRAYWGYGKRDAIWVLVARVLFETAIEKIPPNLISALPIEIGGSFWLRSEVEKGETTTLGQITISDLEFARDRTHKIIEILKTCEILFSLFGRSPHNRLAKAYGKAANSFLRPEWIISTLALFSISASNSRTRIVSQRI